MICFFSGTGNSRYVAERIAAVTGDTLVNLNAEIKNGKYLKTDSTERLIFVVPTYAWRMPRIVEDWITRTEFGTAQAWFVMTCGSEIGNAAKYNRMLCDRKHFGYMGTAGIRMPENYIAMFNAPEWPEAERIIDAAESEIQNAAEYIKSGKAFPQPRNTLYDRLMSGAVNPLFYRFIVKADAFYVKDDCVGCGKCAAECPLNNISMKDGKPIWGKNCTHCMACITACPKAAIEYGRKSVGKPRYRCKK